jgi:hypothetical protein
MAVKMTVRTTPRGQHQLSAVGQSALVMPRDKVLAGMLRQSFSGTASCMLFLDRRIA